MKPFLLGLALLGLTACGVDGDPVTPSANATINIGTNGISTSAGIGVRKGPISIGYSL